MGTFLDEIQEDINKGNKVIYLGCNADLLNCSLNPNKNSLICHSCLYYKNYDLRCLSNDIIKHNLGDFIKKDTCDILNKISFEYKDIDDIKKIYYKGVDIGYSALSTYISKSKTTNPKININFIEFFNNYLLTAIYVYEAFKNAYEKLKPDKIVIYNGRFHTIRPVLRFAQQYKIQCLVLEVIGGKAKKKFEKVYFHNCLPHNLTENTQNIKELWENGKHSVKEKNEIAKQYFINKSIGKAVTDYSFIQKQKNGLLPHNFDFSKKNVVIFSSSDFEMTAIGREREGAPYGSNQLNGLKQITQSLHYVKNIQVYYRIHPNMRKAYYKIKNQLEELNSLYKNLTIIKPNSPINSYDLLKASDIVVTFGSTIGIEANFWRKPVVLLARNIYMNLGGTYNPSTHEEVISLLKKDLKPLNITASLMFGYYQLTRNGNTYRYFDPNYKKEKKINNFFLSNYRGLCIKDKKNKIKYYLNKYTILLLSKILIKFEKYRIPKD